MSKYTKPSLCAVYGVINNSEGRLFGSGAFIKLKSNTYLLTAGHVIKTKQPYKGLAHTCSNGFPPSLFKYPKTILENEFDLGIVKIDAGTISNTNIVPLEKKNLAQSSKNVTDDLLFIHGYPGKRSKSFNNIFTGVASNSLPYVTISGDHSYPWFDPISHIALDYPTEPQIGGHTLPDPHGLSGSPVWHIKHHSNWNSSEAKIIGIVHNWDHKAKSLIATRIEVVRKFILKYLRQECAYFNWISRGKPLGEDLTDWFYACNKIKKL